MGGRTEDIPALAETLVVDSIDDVDDGVAVVVVSWPDGPDPTLASEVPELEDGRGQGYLAGCVEERITLCFLVGERRWELYVLFWPTVGAILSGGRPGVSL